MQVGFRRENTNDGSNGSSSPYRGVTRTRGQPSKNLNQMSLESSGDDQNFPLRPDQSY